MSVSDIPLEPAGFRIGAVLSKYLTPDGWPHWLVYIFAVVLVVATFFLRLSFEEPFGERPHHRVKNHLQIVASLLNLQAKRTPSREVIEVLQDTGNRVHSMALLHEVLYRSANLASINFAAYVAELCRHLRRLAGLVAARVNIAHQVAPVGLPRGLEYA